MSVFALLPEQVEDETPDDSLTARHWEMVYGTSQDSAQAESSLRIQALQEALAAASSEEARDFSLSLPYVDETRAFYRNAYNVLKNCDLHAYGRVPSRSGVFSAVNFFAVEGTFDGAPAAAVLDFYLDPSRRGFDARTLALITPPEETLGASSHWRAQTQTLASAFFGNLFDSEGSRAYRGGSFFEGPWELAGRYGLDLRVSSLAGIQGNLKFRGALQEQMIRPLVESATTVPRFRPSQYVLDTFDVHFSPGILHDSERASEGIPKVYDLLCQTFAQKRSPFDASK